MPTDLYKPGSTILPYCLSKVLRDRTSCQSLTSALLARTRSTFTVHRTIEWELLFLFVWRYRSARYKLRSHLHDSSSSRNYPTPSQTLLTKQLNSLPHPHHQWTLSPTSSTCSQSPLMRRACPRMKKALLVAQGLTHPCVSSPEMPRFSFIFDDLPRHHCKCVLLFLDKKKESLLISWISLRNFINNARNIIINNTITHTGPTP